MRGSRCIGSRRPSTGNSSRPPWARCAPPYAANELLHFRDRIGSGGAEQLLGASVALHGDRAKQKEVVMDTAAQEKAITFPTDAKLHAKIV